MKKLLFGTHRAFNFETPCCNFFSKALWPRSQIGGLVSQRLSPRGAALPNSNGTSSSNAPKKTRRR